MQANHTDAIVMATNLTQHCKYLQNTTVVQHCVGV